MKRFICATLVTAALLPAPALAQHEHHAVPASESPSDNAYMEAHHKMMKEMDVKPTRDADADFVAMMIPHHQGAVDMAEVQLKYGKDPELRKLAREIIAAQEKEIKQMKDWQKNRQ